GAHESRWVHMIGAAADCRFWFRTGAYEDGVLSVPVDSVRIAKDKAAFVFGIGREIENAARELVGNDVVEGVFINSLTAEAQQRKPFFPRRLASSSIGHRDAGVAVVVARDAPLETERDERGPLDIEFPGGDLVGSAQRCSCRQNQYSTEHDYAAHFERP